jgi:hypothetical protein
VRGGGEDLSRRMASSAEARGGDGEAKGGEMATPWSTMSSGRSGEDSDHGLDFGPPTSIALAERMKETRRR